MDAELKRLMAGLAGHGLLGDTIITLASDHGEEFGEHGSMERHGWTLYDEVLLHVPLIIKLLGRRPSGAPTGEAVPPPNDCS